MRYALLVALLSGCVENNAWFAGPRCSTSCMQDSDCVGGRSCRSGECTGEGNLPEPHITVGATSGHLSIPFSITIGGKGSEHVGDVSLQGNTGQVVVDGEMLSAVAYSRAEFPGYVLFQTLAVKRDRWVVLWLYCQGDKLSNVYLHTAAGLATTEEAATGSCAEESGPHDAEVTLEALDFTVPSLLKGHSVQGRDIFLRDDGKGAIRLGGRELALFAYNTVDCSVECGPPGWREVHSILFDVDRNVACFAIVYLFAHEDKVAIEYSLSLPDLSEPAGKDTRICAPWIHEPG